MQVWQKFGTNDDGNVRDEFHLRSSYSSYTSTRFRLFQDLDRPLTDSNRWVHSYLPSFQFNFMLLTCLLFLKYEPLGFNHTDEKRT